MESVNCNHEWKEHNKNKYICSKCRKTKFKKYELDEDRYYIIKNDGKKYTVRKTRKRYFYPDEWFRFMNALTKDYHKLFFDFLIKTGARVEEALLIKKIDLVDDKRKIIKLRVTKSKAKKGEDEGEPRSFNIDSVLYNKLKRVSGEYIFLKNEKIIDLISAKKEAKKKADSLRQLLNRKLLKIGIKDHYNISFHNIRKTHGMYLKAHQIDIGEICNRLGHDYNTYLKHYGSPSLFDRKDVAQMIKILGDIYNLK